MAHLIRAGDLIGHPVVAIDSGEDVAEVRDVVYDAGKHRLVGFTLNKRGIFAGRLKDVLPATSISAIGADAVMIADESQITESEQPEALESPGDSASVIGNRVLSSQGTDLGEVVGVVLETGDDPIAVGYEIDATDAAGDTKADRVFVPISAQMALSGDNLMLPEEATEFVRNDLAGFGAAVTEYRASLDQGSDR